MLLPRTSIFEAFRADRKTVYAVVRALEIISEASRRLPDELFRRHPEIDWAAVAPLRLQQDPPAGERGEPQTPGP